MPELPEVEITRRRISAHLLGRELDCVRTTKPSYFFLTPPTTLKRRLTGQRFRTLRRHGKYLVAELEGGSSLLLHLGMTGQLFAEGAESRLLGAYPDEHTHLTFGFTDGAPRVFFRDVRKFGKVRWLAPGTTDPRLEKLGIDALSVEGEQLYRASRKRKTPIKTLLLDQRVLAGVGNIYADEALFLSGVRPTKGSHRISRTSYHHLAENVRKVLSQSIAAGGSTISDFVAPDGISGSYQEQRLVYGRKGELCSRCEATIQRRLIGQRSSFFCASCQR